MWKAGDFVNERFALPGNVPALQYKLEADGMYLVDNSEYLHFLIFRSDRKDIINEVLS